MTICFVSPLPGQKPNQQKPAAKCPLWMLFHKAVVVVVCCCYSVHLLSVVRRKDRKVLRNRNNKKYASLSFLYFLLPLLLLCYIGAATLYKTGPELR